MKNFCHFKPWIQFQLLIAGIAFILPHPSYSASIAISIDATGAPANDLMYQGQPIDRDQAIDLASQGVDLGTLDPSPNDIWTPNANLPLQGDADIHYPNNGATVSFDSNMGSSQGLFRTRVSFNDAEANVTRPFQMIMGLTSHPSLARNALLRRLGYPIPTPRYYPSLTVRFKDVASRDSFMDSLSDATLTAKKRWIRTLPENTPEVTLQDVTLEPAQIDVPMYHWGVIPAAHIQGRRAIRALILPIVLLDVQESINLYSFELGRILSNSVIFTHPYADSFAETTFQDAAWIARKIALLSREDLREIVNAGKYPDDISALILEKLIARRNQMVDLFKLSDSLPKNQRKLSYEVKINVGSVKNGKLTQENYDGYASRFTYGDPDSPLRKAEVGRFMLLNVISGGLTTLSSQINKFLQIQSTDTVSKEHQADLINKAIDWSKTNPGQPFSQTFDSWGGIFGGFALSASRNVVTGTYYGSTAKVQLVDNLGVTASVGYFLGFDGVPIVVPSFSGNLTLQRNYLHIKPVTDMKSALKTDWSAIWVPRFINQISDLLKEPEPNDPPTTAASTIAPVDPSNPNDTLQGFLDTLKEGEMIVITDSILLGVRGQVNIPIPVLLNPALVAFNPSVGVAASTMPTILRRTTFMRTGEGIQVYLQTAKMVNANFEFNFNWWMNILKLSHENRRGYADTKAYILDKAIENTEDRRKLLVSIRALIRSNDSEVLEENYKEYQLHHKLDVAFNKAKLLWWKAYSLEEEHRVKIEPPGYPDKARTLFSDRYVSNKGVDGYAFLGDIINAASQGFATLPTGSYGLNPANSPLGWSNWTSISTEAETTPEYNANPHTIIEHHWGGWLLSKKGLLKILDEIENRVKPLNLDKPLIRRDEFASTDHLEMYDILSTLIIYEDGIKQIGKTLFDPSIEKAVKGLIEIEGKEEHEKWCSKTFRRIGDTLFFADSFSEKENGKRFRFKCLKPWIRKALKIRHKVIRHQVADTPEGKVQWETRLVKTLQRYMKLDKFLNWVGKDNYFFQIKVSGFRSKDENGDNEYVSDSLGTFKPKDGAGAFRDFSTKYGIMTNELYARYLSEGYQGF